MPHSAAVSRARITWFGNGALRTPFAAVLALCTTACTAELAANGTRFDALRDSIQAVARSGAYSCAPLELALARAHFAFAGVSLRQGNPQRAAQHLDEAEENVGAAQVLSPKERCHPGEERPIDRTGTLEPEIIAPPPDAKSCANPDAPGCSDRDADGDGVKDSVDACPQQPEDFDGNQDQDGCPDLDNDSDGIDDGRDACPDSPGDAENQGCPKKDYPDVTIVERELRLAVPINFDGNSATIRSVSLRVLDTVAELLRDHPRMTLEIGAHTDSQGDDTDNLLSSQEQAESVRKYLVAHGVDSARLTARGYGETRPIESNSTSQGRAINRRIELVRTDRAP
jgi:outer membrane protein OmpA-like peptidoglycan-associated protein